MWLTEPGKARRLVFEGHNAVGSDLIGYLHYWTAKAARSQPISHVGFTYSTTEVLKGTTNSVPALVPITEGCHGYYTIGTATWKNETGADKTITGVRLLNAQASGILEWGTLSGLTQSVVVGAELEVEWTLSFRQVMDDNAVLHSPSVLTFFQRICTLFYTATTTSPISHVSCYSNNGAHVVSAIGDPVSGGGTDSTSIVWQVSTEAPAGAATMARIDLLCNDQSGILAVDSNTGRSDTWVASTSAAVQVTMTWTASGSGQINSSPTGAAIWIGGVNTGFTTDKLITPIAVGTYAVILKKTSYVDYPASLVITDGATTTISATLTPV